MSNTFSTIMGAYKEIAEYENKPEIVNHIQKTYWNAEKGIYELPDEREENKKDMKITKVSKNESLLTKLESLEEELKSIKRELAESTSDEKWVIYKQFGKYKATPKSNYDPHIMNAREVSTFDDFESAEDVKEYMLKYFKGLTSDDIEILDESKSLDEHLVNKDELVRGRHIKFADKSDGYTLKDAYILWADDFDVNKYDVVYTEEELRNLDGRKAVTIQYKDIAQVLDLIEVSDPDDELLDGEPEIDYHVTGDALDKMKANRFSDPEYFDKDDAGEFFVTGYGANYEYSPAEGGDYYIEGWYPVCSKAFETIEQARKYLYDCKKEYQKDGFKVYDYTQDSFHCEEDSIYVAHEEYKYFVEPKAKRYSRTEKGHGWDW